MGCNSAGFQLVHGVCSLDVNPLMDSQDIVSILLRVSLPIPLRTVLRPLRAVGSGKSRSFQIEHGSSVSYRRFYEQFDRPHALWRYGNEEWDPLGSLGRLVATVGSCTWANGAIAHQMLFHSSYSMPLELIVSSC